MAFLLFAHHLSGILLSPDLTDDEQLAARTASRKAKKIRQKERRAKEAGERAASEAERAEAPRPQLRENIEYVVAGLRSAAAQARSQAGSKIEVEYSLPPERDDGYRRGPSKVYAKVPQGTVATTVASDWLANELAEYGLSPGCQAVRCCQVICRAVGQLSGTVRCLCQTSCQVLSVLSGAVGCLSDIRGAP